MYKILVINLGGTSGKAAIFEDAVCTHEYSYDYTAAETNQTCTASEEVQLKCEKIMAWLDSIGVRLDDIDVFAPRMGGTFYGGDGGTFAVEGALRAHLESIYRPDEPAIHATYISLQVCNELQKRMKAVKPIFTTDPSTIDQFLPEARITGNPLFRKRNSFHALNQRAVARKAAEDMGKSYGDVNVIVVHAGGGVSVGAHEKGRVIDVNDSSGDGDGPFSPNRAGTLPTGQLVHECFSGKYANENQAFKLLKGNAGIRAYLGTDDLRVVEKRVAEGDAQAELIFKALAYQIAREIGACAATLCGKVDAIVLTAGMMHCKPLVELIRQRVGFLAPFMCYPGGFENEALALGALRVLKGEEPAAVYQGEAKAQPGFRC